MAPSLAGFRQQKWFATTTAELTDYLQQRIIQRDTAKPIEACPACGTE
jgi:hypothetical protein